LQRTRDAARRIRAFDSGDSPVTSENSTRPIALSFNREELTFVNNALNEVCNGIDLTDDEFHTRLGGSREEARAVLARVAEALDGDSD
jgi:hypothetical protein